MYTLLAMGQVDFPDLLRGALKESGLSQTTLAERIGSSQPHISDLINRRKKPSPAMAKQLAKALNAPVDVFLMASGFAPEGAMPPQSPAPDWWKAIPESIRPGTEEIARANELGRFAPPNMDPRTDKTHWFWRRDRAARKRLFALWEMERDEIEGDGEGGLG